MKMVQDLFFFNSEDMVDFLNQKFMEKKDPVYHVKEIDVKQLEIITQLKDLTVSKSWYSVPTAQP